MNNFSFDFGSSALKETSTIYIFIFSYGRFVSLAIERRNENIFVMRPTFFICLLEQIYIRIWTKIQHNRPEQKVISSLQVCFMEKSRRKSRGKYIQYLPRNAEENIEFSIFCWTYLSMCQLTNIFSFSCIINLYEYRYILYIVVYVYIRKSWKTSSTFE